MIENGLDMELNLESEAFDSFREDFNMMLQACVKRMYDKKAENGKLSITIDVDTEAETVKNFDPNIAGEERVILKPTIKHKVAYSVQLKDEQKNEADFDGYELVFDEDEKRMVLKRVCNTQQRSIFDADFVDVSKSESTETLFLGTNDVDKVDKSNDNDAEETTEDLPFSDESNDGYDYIDPDEIG